jgi:hypothetical protein
MQRHHPAPYERIPVTMEVYNRISLAIFWDNRHDVTHWEIVAEAVDEWLRHHSPDAITLPAHLGYQWKQLFLPNGTILRTVFSGKNYHCRVENDQILYEGKPVSPSGFVNTVGGMRRNAWKSLWILRPESADWQRADSLRPRQRSFRHRKASAAHEAQAPDLPHPSPKPQSERPPEQAAAHAKEPQPGLPGRWRRKPRPRTRLIQSGGTLATLLRQELLPFVRELLGLPASGAGEMLPTVRRPAPVQNL